ncbi:MAG: protein-tyrosine phosphatase family protein [Desulfosalsimonadaceae bacterium]
MSIQARAEQVPFSRSYWVIPGLFLAGEYPGAAQPEAAREKLGRLLDAGVRQIINLMEPHETNFSGNVFVPYEDILHELARQRNISAGVRRFSIPDMRTPGPGKMRQILDTIDSRLARQIPVYVHCLGGLGRTGTVVGCFLLRRGMAHAEDVLEQITRLRSNEPLAHLPSPEAGIQREFIRRWEG